MAYDLKKLMKQHHKAMELVKIGGKKRLKKETEGLFPTSLLLELNSPHRTKYLSHGGN